MKSILSSLIITILTLSGLTSLAAGPSQCHRYLDAPLPQQWNVTDTTGMIVEPASAAQSSDPWLQGFNDPLLDSLIAIGREANYDLATAATRISIAKAQMKQAQAAYYPTLSASAAYTRTRISGANTSTAVPASTQSYFSATVDMSWEVDIFGKITRQVRRGDVLVKAAAAEYDAALLSVDASIASTYFGLLAQREQLSVARRHSTRQEHIMNTTVSRYNAGLGSKLDVTQARTLYYSTSAAIPMLEASIDASINALAVLLGTDPAMLPQGVFEERPLPDFSRTIALYLPEELLRRRPDIVQAERNIEAAAAALGIARDAYLPSLSLQGSIGTSAHCIDDLFSRPSLTYSVAPTLSWTVFDGLSRRYTAVEAQESLKSAISAYNLTVLTAVQEVRNAATSYANSLAYISSLENVVESAEESTTLSFDLYRQGLSSFINVDNAEVNNLTYANSLITAKADALNYLINLYKALGGSFQY